MRNHATYRVLLLGFAALVAIIASLGLFGGFRLNVTESLPLGVYRTISEKPRRGSIVIVCLSREVAEFARERAYLGPGFCTGQVRGLGKIVLATPGDVVTHRAEEILVNRKPIANSKTLSEDSRTRPLPHHPWGEYVLGTQQIWLYSPYRRNSYDSRYFGPVHTSQIVSVLRPMRMWRRESVGSSSHERAVSER